MKEMKEEGGKKKAGRASERERVREFGERQNLGRGGKEKKGGDGDGGRNERGGKRVKNTVFLLHDRFPPSQPRLVL